MHVNRGEKLRSDRIRFLHQILAQYITGIEPNILLNSPHNNCYLLNFVPTFLQNQTGNVKLVLTPYLGRDFLGMNFKIDSLVLANIPLRQALQSWWIISGEI